MVFVMESVPLKCPSSKQAKKAARDHQPHEGGPGPSAEPPMAEPLATPPPAGPIVPLSPSDDGPGGDAGSSDSTAPAAPLPNGLDCLTAVSPKRQFGLPSVIAAAAAAAGPRSVPSDIIRPVIMKLVVAAADAASDAFAPAPSTSSALAAVQRVRRMMDESRRKKQEENECIVCFERPMTTALRPCGHMQLCSRCCRKLVAIAESKKGKPEVRFSPPDVA